MFTASSLWIYLIQPRMWGFRSGLTQFRKEAGARSVLWLFPKTAQGKYLPPMLFSTVARGECLHPGLIPVAAGENESC